MKIKKYYIFLVICLALVGGVLFLSRQTADPNRQIDWGITFEKDFAQKLGLDWRAAYVAILDDLKIKKIRLAARWSDIESEKDKFNFADLDWLINQAQQRKAQVILVVGYKVPRWPECHNPDWVDNLPVDVLDYIEKIIERYKDNQAIVAWQVENEPFLPFGECPKFDVKLLDQEIMLVKALDSRPVVVTDSGELSVWVRAAQRGDIFGTTMYRWVWNEYLGSYKYPITPGFFRFKERMTRFFVGQEKPFMVIELQGEPWTHKQIYEISLQQQLELMPFDEFTGIIDYAKATGFSEYYLWGGEWWYSLKQQGRGEYWDYVKNLVKE